MRVWLVERDYDDKGLLRLVYATPDGDRSVSIERAAARAGDVTAATEVDRDRLEPVADPDRRERYATEVERVRERNDPTDRI